MATFGSVSWRYSSGIFHVNSHHRYFSVKGHEGMCLGSQSLQSAHQHLKATWSHWCGKKKKNHAQRENIFRRKENMWLTSDAYMLLWLLTNVPSVLVNIQLVLPLGPECSKVTQREADTNGSVIRVLAPSNLPLLFLSWNPIISHFPAPSAVLLERTNYNFTRKSKQF